MLTSALTPALLTLPCFSRALAFQNALPEVAAETGRKPSGPAPEGIGIAKNGGLRPCLDGKPHCFSSTTSVGETKVDTSKIGTDWVVQPWTYGSKTVIGALKDIQDVVDAYPAGQNDIDAGGFKVMKVRIPEAPDDPAYMYVQFEARAGYIDDMEFLAQRGKVQVRTSSRVGYLDYGTNAKRYNWFSKQLGAKSGWSTYAIRQREHLEYAGLNDLSSDEELGF